MARVVLQAGHVARRTGATGTTGEQPLNQHVCDLAAAKLRAYGHTTRVILADEVYTGPAEVFIAHHADGSETRTASGASVGYPDADGGRLAHQFKIAYAARGWPYGYRADNYTPGLRGYYAYSRHSHITRRMVIEAGFMTNPDRDRPWIDAHHGTIAQAVADAVNAVYGTPNPQEDDMPLTDADVAKIWRYAYLGGEMRDWVHGGRTELDIVKALVGDLPQSLWEADVLGEQAGHRLAGTDLRAQQILASLPDTIAARLEHLADPEEVKAAVLDALGDAGLTYPDPPPSS